LFAEVSLLDPVKEPTIEAVPESKGNKILSIVE
jgi:hypothetical protein